MGLLDTVLMVAIVGGALWLLYHSLWKKKGHCQGCTDGGCSKKKS